MALPSLAPVSALETRLGLAPGDLSGADLARAEDALEDVSTLVRAEAGLEWVDADGVTITAPDPVVTVVRQAALRVYRNPDGYTGENVGDYGWQAAGAAVGVYLTDEEKRIVRTAADGGRKNVQGTIRTPSAYFDPKTGWADPGLFLWGLE